MAGETGFTAEWGRKTASSRRRLLADPVVAWSASGTDLIGSSAVSGALPTIFRELEKADVQALLSRGALVEI